MIAAAVRQTADWLADATTGVNAIRSTVPRDGGEPAPAAVTIYDETREPWIARRQVPRKKTGSGPLLLVAGPDEVEVPIFGSQGDQGFAPCEVMVAYVRRAPIATEESDDVVRDVYQTLRIAARSLALQYTEQEANPTRMSVGLDRPTVKILRTAEPFGDDGEVISGLLSITYPAIDPWAMAAIS